MSLGELWNSFLFLLLRHSWTGDNCLFVCFFCFLFFVFVFKTLFSHVICIFTILTSGNHSQHKSTWAKFSNICFLNPAPLAWCSSWLQTNAYIEFPCPNCTVTILDEISIWLTLSQPRLYPLFNAPPTTTASKKQNQWLALMLFVAYQSAGYCNFFHFLWSSTKIAFLSWPTPTPVCSPLIQGPPVIVQRPTNLNKVREAPSRPQMSLPPRSWRDLWRLSATLPPWPKCQGTQSYSDYGIYRSVL